MTFLKKRNARGFTLVELMIVVAIIGILAALAIVGVKKYMLNAKTAEARNSLGTLSSLASQVWSGEKLLNGGAILAPGGTVGSSHNLCDSTGLTPVPASADLIKGLKYQSNTDPNLDFHKGTATSGWRCLGFSLDSPQYFQYDYAAVAGASFDAIAHGDLNADGVLSTFSRPGKIVAGEITLSPGVVETNPDE